MPRSTSQQSKGDGTCAPTALEKPETFRERTLFARDDRAAHDVRMARQVLRRRMHDEVVSERERPLQERRRPRVVARDQRPRAMRQGADGFQVRDRNRRIRRSFRPDETRGRLQRAFDGRQIRHVDERDVKAPGSEVLLQELGRPVVHVERRDDVVAGFEGLKNGHRRGRARRKRDCRRPALELRERLLQGAPVRVRFANVRVAGRKRSVRGALKRGRQMNRGRNRAGRRIRSCGSVHGESFEFQVVNIPRSRVMAWPAGVSAG